MPAVLVPAAADHGRPAGRHTHQTTPHCLIAGPGASFAACRLWDSNPELGLVSRSSSLSQQLQRRIQTPSGGCQCARTRFKKCTTRVGRLTWTHKEASGTADRRGSALCASQQASPTILASTVSRFQLQKFCSPCWQRSSAWAGLVRGTPATLNWRGQHPSNTEWCWDGARST